MIIILIGSSLCRLFWSVRSSYLRLALLSSVPQVPHECNKNFIATFYNGAQSALYDWGSSNWHSKTINELPPAHQMEPQDGELVDNPCNGYIRLQDWNIPDSQVSWSRSPSAHYLPPNRQTTSSPQTHIISLIPIQVGNLGLALPRIKNHDILLLFNRCIKTKVLIIHLDTPMYTQQVV